MASYNGKIGFIGGGKMAFAIVSGLLLKKVVKPEQIKAASRHIENLKNFTDVGAFVTNNNNEIVSTCDIIFICVKPKQLESCCLALQQKYANQSKTKKMFVSVLAGVKLNKLEECLDFIENVKIVRTMPNTSVQVGEGCIVFSRGKYMTDNDVEEINSILSPLGLVQEFTEDLIDPITGIAGCGPAFVYTIIEALADGAVKEGVPKNTAIKFTAQTLLGASKTLLLSGKHPAVLRDEVCSPGGSTICGIHELEKGNLRATLINAVEKSVQKSQNLGNLSQK